MSTFRTGLTPRRLRRRNSWLGILLLILTLLLPDPATAYALSRQDALIIVRSLLMLVPRPPADAAIAVLPAGDAQSQIEEAEAMAALLKSSAARVRVVPLNRLHEAVGAAAVLVPPGLPASALQTLPVQTLLIGFDADCVAQDRCLLYIRSVGQVSITLNRQRFARSGLRFDPAYRLLMKEQ